MSNPIALDNSTMQGDPSSMNYYSFYNVPLIEMALGDNKLSPGFVDDSMVLVISNSLTQCHGKLKDMMEQPNGGFRWSLTHNSPFELSKTTLMNFPRSYRDPILGVLHLDKPNADGSVTSSLMNLVSSYKYLGIIIDPKLHWMLQHKKAAAAGSFWASQIGRLSKPASGLSTAGTKQLYNTVTVPRFTYRVEVWYSPIYKPQGSLKSRGLISVNNKLKSAQWKVAAAITDSLRTTAGDILDVHAYILPIDLLLNKLLYRAALHLCSLLKSHPLHAQLRSCSIHSAKHHLLPRALAILYLKDRLIKTCAPPSEQPPLQVHSPHKPKFRQSGSDQSSWQSAVASQSIHHRQHPSGGRKHP